VLGEEVPIALGKEIHTALGSTYPELHALGKEIHTALGTDSELHALGKEIHTALGTDSELREEAVLGLEAALGNAECLHGPYSNSVYHRT
jgi:hypothetical protein